MKVREKYVEIIENFSKIIYGKQVSFPQVSTITLLYDCMIEFCLLYSPESAIT